MTALPRWVPILAAAIAVGLIGGGVWLWGGEEAPAPPSDAETSTTEGNAPVVASSEEASAEPPSAAVEAPEGMVHVPGGSTRIGVERAALRQIAADRPEGPRPMWGRAATPAFTAQVDAFFLDVHPVTVAQFRDFVEATGYTTQAERFGNGGVLDSEAGQWRLVDGATWRRPRGPDAPAAADDHPVTQVSWNDAQAYCEWAGKRLPTEVEWEHAARDANNDRSYCPWGSDCSRQRRVENANTWQGRYPTRNTAADGYRYTAPVGAFDTTALGLTGMAGNVWEWTASWYRPYGRRDAPLTSKEKRERVQRGGSFLCHECGGYHVFARSHSTPETSLFHVGVRCAKDVPSE
jgi:sulfatase modifying factor 1